VADVLKQGVDLRNLKNLPFGQHREHLSAQPDAEIKSLAELPDLLGR
jgi:hypothetical protein